MGAFFMGAHMKQIDVNHRTLLAVLLKATVTAVAANYWTGLASADETMTIRLPEVDATGDASFAMFHALSRIVTLREHLDEDVARRMYPLFLAEPWGAHHIRSTYAQLLAVLNLPAATRGPNHPATNTQLGNAQAWFAGHVLTTWYLGVYYHERTAPIRVVHSEALMFDVAGSTLPRPYVEATGFGNWSHRPTGLETK